MDMDTDSNVSCLDSDLDIDYNSDKFILIILCLLDFAISVYLKTIVTEEVLSTHHIMSTSAHHCLHSYFPSCSHIKLTILQSLAKV